MFSALKLWVVMLVVSVAFAVDIQVPETPASGGMTTITWTTDPSFTQPFSIELVHPDFNNAFAIANNVKASLGTLNVSLPTVAPGDGYTLEFVNITNINQKYGTSPSFSIAAAPSTTASSTATSPGTSGTAPSVSAASAETSISGSVDTSIPMSGMSASASASASSSRSASVSAASATASNAATRELVQGASTLSAAVFLGLVSAWIL